MIELKYRHRKITYAPYLIFSQNQLHPSLLQFSNPSIWQPVPNSGPKAIRETTILNHPVHPFKSTHYHPPSGSQNRFPDPYSARTSLEFQLKRAFSTTQEGESNLRTNPPVSISRHIPWTLCASLLCEAIVCDQYGWASPGACYGRRLRRPQLSLSTPSVETENPFKALTRDPLYVFYSFQDFSSRKEEKENFPSPSRRMDSPFHVENEKRGWGWTAMIRSNGVRNRLVSLGDREKSDVCDWILVEFNPGLDSMNFLKGDALLGIWEMLS